nr:aspartate/glutamate racemase family protein [Mesobacillus harenae]
MPNNGIELSKLFNEVGTDIIVYSCAETAFLKGVDGNEYISKRIEEITNQPAITAMSCMVEAAKALNIKKVSLVTPYTEERTRVMIDFFKRMGIETLGANSEDFSKRSKDTREWYECNLQPPSTAYVMAKEANNSDSDAIMISATNFRTFEMIEKLEEDLGKPVITTNQAILWAVFNRLGMHTKVPGLGRLLNQ